MQVSPSPFPLTQQIIQQQLEHLGGPAPQPQQQQMAPPQQQQHQATQPQQPFYPSLHLYPLNDTFIPKQISLAPQLGRVKIGRQTNAKTVPGERNGYFDSKVLSRQHAEVWEEGGKVFIRDVKSSNGTFINGDRLSQEGVESEPFELKTDDTVEFGIDIVGEDNKSIIHHKVAAKVVVVVTPEDAQALALHAPQPRRPPVGTGPANHMAGNAALGGLGGLGPRGTRTHGLTFDHILNRLQNELSKSRETGAELNQLTGVMTEIQDTLGGSGPPNLPTFPTTLPPVRPHPTTEGLAPPPTATVPTTNGSLSNIEVQLHETQSSLAAHLDKIRQLESVIVEHEAMKQDVTYIKDQIKEQMEERRREMDLLMMRQLNDEARLRAYRNGSSKDDDEDARSVSTVMPDDDEEPIVDEIEEQQLLQQSGAGGLRPRTPEPHGLAYDEEDRQRQSSAPSEPSTSSAPSSSSSSSSDSLAAPSPAAVAPAPAFDLSELFSQNATLVSKLEALTSQLDSAMELSKTLQHQATLAQGTISVLEAKVGSLEAQVDEQKKIQAELLEKQVEESSASSSKTMPPSVSETPSEPAIHLSKWEEWKDTIHSAWTSERESWESEQKKLATVIQECERRMKNLEEKEEDRRQREETESQQRRISGFGESDSEEEVDDGDQSPTEDVFGLEAPNGVKSIPKLPNGIHKKGVDGKPRRKNRPGKPNGIANGLLPSPVASPTSSSSSYAAHRRGDSSPTRERERLQINGKLPLSPPNTSPRSRAESLPRDVDDESDLKESTPAPSDYVTDPSQSLGKFSKHTTQLTDLPMPYLSAAGMVVIGLAAYAVINRIKD